MFEVAASSPNQPAMTFEGLRSPVQFIRHMSIGVPHEDMLDAYQDWWEKEGSAISFAIDRGGTPWLRMFDRFGNRVDEILYPPEYGKLLKEGYRAGVIWRAFEEVTLIHSYLLLYLTSFYDVGLSCPYTVSLATALSLEKYGDSAIKARYLSPLVGRGSEVWQGATWMTEAKGGSDLGATVETTAACEGDHWSLSGEKYFASNVGAELAVVAARPDGAPPGPRGLALFLLPRYRRDGNLNYLIRRIKDKIATRSVPTGEVELRNSEAYLLGKAEWGIYLILEVLNVSRVANAIGSVALAQRALCEALTFAERRSAFGKPILQHPLLRKQFGDRSSDLEAAFALAWEAVELLEEVWREIPPYSERYQLFRLVAHLAKYWTAEVAARAGKWAMEVHGGMGVLAEFPVERLLREAMIVTIWEGTPHRQILDGLEVMERKGAHRLLFEHLGPHDHPSDLEEVRKRVESHLALPREEREARAEEMFADLAALAARILLGKRRGGAG